VVAAGGTAQRRLAASLPHVGSDPGPCEALNLAERCSQLSATLPRPVRARGFDRPSCPSRALGYGWWSPKSPTNQQVLPYQLVLYWW
jgi:hypothetical protein